MSIPLLLGHRGARASRHIPENTLESFELCLQHGCDGFEFDVRCSSDGHGVICHDANTNGMLISDTSAQRLALPALDDVLQQFANRAYLDIELKVAGVERQMLAALHEFPPQKGYVVSSFLPSVLTTIHGIDAQIPLGLLCESRGQLRGWSEFAGEWIVPRHDLVDEELAASVNGAGKKIMVWTGCVFWQTGVWTRLFQMRRKFWVRLSGQSVNHQGH